MRVLFRDWWRLVPCQLPCLRGVQRIRLVAAGLFVSLLSLNRVLMASFP